MTITISGTSGVTYPAGGLANTAGAGVGTTDSQTLTNKTLTTPTIATIKSAASGTPTVFQDSAGTEVGQLCRAWVRFTMTTTPSVSTSFNVSSVTYSSATIWVVNFTNALTDANYAITTSAQTSGGNRAVSFNQYSGVAPTTTSCQVQYYDTASGQSATGLYASVAVFR